MPEFEKKYKKTSKELHDEELIEKDDFGETPEEIEKNTTAVLEKYDREANVRVYKGFSRVFVRMLFVLFSMYAIFLLFYPGTRSFCCFIRARSAWSAPPSWA